MTTNTLLVEIFTEELPPKALATLGESFAERLVEGLKSRNLLAPGSTHRGFATPRRLAVSVSGVLDRAPDSENVNKIPASVALTSEGRPSIALLKKLGSRAHLAEGLPDVWDGPDHLYMARDGKADYVFLRTMAKGTSLQVGLEAALEDALETLPIPKVMRYQTEQDAYVEFVRPAHGLIALHGSDVVPVSVLGLQAGRVTHGHRFQGANDIILSHADEYESRLRDEGGLIARFTARRAEIERQLNAQASALGADLRLTERDALLDEVTALVEMPTVYVGEFEKEFLAVPQECLILTMQANQKYFPLFDGAGKLTNKFLIVSNMRLDDPKNIVEGNQRVIRPRLADARFFFEKDKKVKLETRVEQLRAIVYHNTLGSQYERSERIQFLSREIAERFFADGAGFASRAGILCKADLVTNMVAEFPELQGVMGGYYARYDGESDDVAIAIADHYKPRYSGDELPRTRVGCVVALADKLYTLAGLFGIGQSPTGDKDPFGLRRHALGVIRILLEKNIPVGLQELIRLAQTQCRIQQRDRLRPKHDISLETYVYLSGPIIPIEDFPPTDESMRELADFVYDRLAGLLRERGYSPQEIDSIVSLRPDFLHEVPKRIEAVRAFLSLPEAEALSAANKRTRNILKKANGIGEAYNPTVSTESAEKQLHASVARLAPEVTTRVAAQDYAGALKQLAGIRGDVDRFFDDVMVMADDPVVRANRLALLSQLEKLMNQVADISKLAA